MRLDSRLQKSRHGIYYLRIQRAGIDRKWSLRTRSSAVAQLAAHEFSAKLLLMDIDDIDLSRLAGWTIRTDGKWHEIITEDNDADRKSAAVDALPALQKLINLQNQHQYSPPNNLSPIQL